MLRHLEYEDWYKYEFIKDKFHKIIDCIDVLVDGLYDDSLNDNVGQKGIRTNDVLCRIQSLRKSIKNLILKLGKDKILLQMEE